MAVEAEKVRLAVAVRYRQDKVSGQLLDNCCSSEVNKITSKVHPVCVPGGMVKSFPANCMLLMTATGAKGSSVNTNQIASHLGQQELEGRRVPLMGSGKTLPCFKPYDVEARASGFIADRFLTGEQALLRAAYGGSPVSVM